ncbi:hypothetical protein [Amycolatopsis sp. NPDC059657]
MVFGVLISATGFGMETGLQVSAGLAAALLGATAVASFRNVTPAAPGP